MGNFICIPLLTRHQVYLEAVYRHPKYLATIVFSTQAVLLGFTASGCIVFASNIWVAAGLEASAWQERGVAIGVIVVVTLTHTFVPKAGVWAMNALSSIKIIILIFIVIVSRFRMYYFIAYSQFLDWVGGSLRPRTLYT
jgi:hypothetical protein